MAQKLYFTFSTSSLRPPADGTSYYARRFPKPKPYNLKKYSETLPTGILAELRKWKNAKIWFLFARQLKRFFSKTTQQNS